ncbi:MAG: hypothetical protein M3340_03200 [Actinomycetota bacterium]|nr:hypothetical protein [Actinomycetota bacterium]
MAFGSRRLRVQLPCGERTRVVEVAADERTPCPVAFATGCPSEFVSACPVQLATCADFRTGVCAPESCPPGSCLTGTHCYWTNPAILPSPRGGLVAADDLPLLRGRLEQRMREIDAFARALKEQVQEQLDDLGKAEQALRDRDAGP